MKIIIGVHHFPPRYTGGAEWQAFRIARALQTKGHSVWVVAIEEFLPHTKPKLEWKDEIYENIPIRRLFISHDTTPDRLGYVYLNPLIGDHLINLFSEYKPDIFHLISGYLMSASSLQAAFNLGIPTIVNLIDFWFLCPRIQMLRSNGQISTLPIQPENCARCLGEEKLRYRLLGRIFPRYMNIHWKTRSRDISAIKERMRLLKSVLSKVDIAISNSQFLRNVFIEAGMPPDRIRYSRQGLDLPVLSPEILKKTPSPNLRIGYLGQITEFKGVHILLEAIRELSDQPLSVYIYGNPNSHPTYTRKLCRIAAANPRVVMMGVYQSGDLGRVLQNLDVIVVPSLWYENSPNVILEAFAHRTPVIASNLGGMAELVQDNVSGLLFPPGDSHTLAKHIYRLIHEPGLLRRLTDQIPIVKTVNQEMDELEGFYYSILRSN